MRLDTEYIHKLRDLPIQQVAQQLGLQVVRGRCLCPFHPDKHPSMSFSAKSNTCRCWSCGASADSIALTQQVLGKSFREACEWLTLLQPSLAGSGPVCYAATGAGGVPSAAAGEGRPYREYPPDVAWLSSLVEHPYLNDEARRFLYDERRIDPRVVRWCRLSSINTPTPCYRGGRPFFDAPSLLIPYFAADGRLLSLQSRYLGRQEGVPRFRYPRNSNCPIYNLPVLRMLHDDEPLYIAEGVSDCLAMLSAGHKAIAIGSATLLRDDDLVAALGEVRGWPSAGCGGNQPTTSSWHGPLCMCPDNDAPGEALYQQVIRVATRLGLPLSRFALPTGCKDFGAYFARGLE